MNDASAKNDGGKDETLHERRCGAWMWRVMSEAVADELADVLKDPDAIFGLAAAEVQSLKQDYSTSVTAVGHPPEWVIKRYQLDKLLNPVKDLFRGTAAERAFKIAVALGQADIGTAEVAAYGVQRRMGMPVGSCLISAYLPGVRALIDVLPDGPSDGVLDAVAELLARLHDAGFAHRDLKANNILVCDEGEQGGGRAMAYLVDLDGVRQVRQVSRPRREKNLGRLRRSFLEWPKASHRAWDAFSAHYREHTQR